MKPGIAISLFISIILIGGAFWTRIDASKNEAGLIAVANQDPNEDFYKDVFLNPSVDPTPVSTSTAPQGPLTGTDLVGRQLIIDYVDLTSMGQASDINIELLAERYAESIPTLVNSQKIDYFDIKTVPNNLESLKKYSDDLGQIYIKYSGKMSAAPTASLSSETLNSSYYLFAQEIGDASDLIAGELKNLSVPLSLATLHLELANTHLLNSSAAKNIQENQDDPLSSLAGLIILNENLDKEIHTLQEIDKIFKANGI